MGNGYPKSKIALTSITIISLLAILSFIVSALSVTDVNVSYLTKDNNWVDANDLGVVNQNLRFEIPSDTEFIATKIELRVDEEAILVVDGVNAERINGEFSRTYPWAIKQIEVTSLPQQIKQRVNIRENPDAGVNLFAIGLGIGRCIVDNYVYNLNNDFRFDSLFDGGLGFASGFSAGYNCVG